MVTTIFAFLALATHSSIQTNGFSVGNGNRVQNKEVIARKIPCVVHNRVSTSRLFAEEEGTAVEEIVAETTRPLRCPTCISLHGNHKQWALKRKGDYYDSTPWYARTP